MSNWSIIYTRALKQEAVDNKRCSGGCFWMYTYIHADKNNFPAWILYTIQARIAE